MTIKEGESVLHKEEICTPNGSVFVRAHEDKRGIKYIFVEKDGSYTYPTLEMQNLYVYYLEKYVTDDGEISWNLEPLALTQIRNVVYPDIYWEYKYKVETPPEGGLKIHLNLNVEDPASSRFAGYGSLGVPQQKEKIIYVNIPKKD